MFRTLVIIITMLFLSSCARYMGQNPRKPPMAAPRVLSEPSKELSVDGVYRFVSRTTALTAPKQSTEKVTDAEWYGIWIFQNGYFSQTRGKKDRTEWTPAHFPDNPNAIGFDGGSGSFSVRDKTIELKYLTSFYPGRTGMIETLQFNVENDTLTLTEQMAPHMESLATGQRVTVLRRVK